MHDCIVVGGGPAGISTALLLARARRSVVVCDEGRQRNRASEALHGYLTRDGTPPAEFIRLAREELARYDTVAWRDGVAEAVERVAEGFRVSLSGGLTLEGTVLVLATGMRDAIPDLPGIDAFYGRSIHHCPYCDGWEHRDQPIAVYGQGAATALFAQRMLRWSRQVTVCSSGPPDMAEEDLAALARHGIPIREEIIAALEGEDGQLARVVLAGGEALAVEAMFFCTGHAQRSPLAESLGVKFLDNGAVDSAREGTTNIEDVYVVGDASRDAQLIVMAAAEGAAAGVAINERLTRAELARGLDPFPA